MKPISLHVGAGGLGATYRSAAVAEKILAEKGKNVVFLDEYEYEVYQDSALFHAIRSGHLAEGHIVDLLRENPDRCRAISFNNTMDKPSYALSENERISIANKHWNNAIEKGLFKAESFIIIDYVLVNSNLEFIQDKLEKIVELNLSVFLIVHSLDTNSHDFKMIEKYVSTITYGCLMPRDAVSKACLDYVNKNNFHSGIIKGKGGYFVTFDLDTSIIKSEFVPHREVRSSPDMIKVAYNAQIAG